MLSGRARSLFQVPQVQYLEKIVEVPEVRIQEAGRIKIGLRKSFFFLAGGEARSQDRGAGSCEACSKD